MTLPQFVVLILLGSGAFYVQLQYAKANYPDTPRWRFVLFSSAFLFGFFTAVLFGFQGLTLGRLLVFAVLGGLFSGLGFTFVFPSRMQAYYPKRNKSEDSDQE